MSVSEIFANLFTFEDYGELVALLSNSLIAAALLGVVGGLISVFVMAPSPSTESPSSPSPELPSPC